MPSPPKLLPKSESLKHIGKVNEPVKDQPKPFQFGIEIKDAHIRSGSITILERSQLQEMKNSSVVPAMTSRSSKEKTAEPSIMIEKSLSKNGALPTV